MKVLITGGAGFIGSHLADRIVERGGQVLVIDNYATGRRDNLSLRDGLHIVQGTIADSVLVERVVDDFGPEFVVHAAASYKDPSNWTEDSLTNVVGTANVVQAAKRVGVQRLVYFQTALCYGLHPIEQPISLLHPINPGNSSYAISKTAGEQYVMLSGLDYLSFRLANAYGPRNLSGPLPTFSHRLTNGKSCFVMDTRRDFIYIDDLLEVVVKALEGVGASGVYHISSGRDCAIKDLYNSTVEALGLSPAPEADVRARSEDDAYTILLDPSKTEQTFHWKATTTLHAGVLKTVEWYKQHGLSETYTHLKAVGSDSPQR